MSDMPVREMDLGADGPAWGKIVIAMIALVIGLALWSPWQNNDGHVAPVAVSVANTVVSAEPSSLKITILAKPAGGKVFFDKRNYGQSPVVLEVPTDSEEHELCVQHGVKRHCRSLTGQSMALVDPYVFDTTR